jgi:hypothetical protein
MRNLFLIALAVILYNLSDAQAPIQVDCNGNVGINVTPSSSYKFYVNGKTYITGSQTRINSAIFEFYSGYSDIIVEDGPCYGPAIRPENSHYCNVGSSNKMFSQIWSDNYNDQSDARLKENIRDINNALDIVLQLKGVKYDLKKEYAYVDSFIKDEETRTKFEAKRKNKIGLIAQDVIKILPEVVTYDDSTDIYGIDYTKFVPVLVEAIKEQQLQLELLQTKIEKSLIDDSNLKSTISNNSENSVQLFQNHPNPFNENTVINYYIPESSQKALICIYDLNGIQKKSYNIATKGNSSIIINGYELQQGIYLYSLIVDGKEVDTKRMILTD